MADETAIENSAPRSSATADGAATENFALRAMDALESEGAGAPGDDDFSLKLNQALQAISAAQGEAPPDTGTPTSAVVHTARVAHRAASYAGTPTSAVVHAAHMSQRGPSIAAGAGEVGALEGQEGTLDPQHPRHGSADRPGLPWLGALDKLPPIRLPFGPLIPWRLGLPMLVALLAAMLFVGRPTGRADAQGVQLPSQETYAVQQEAPLFTGAKDATQAEPQPTPKPAGTQATQQLGVPEPAGLSVDFVDMGIKLIAVLALAYGSMMLLKRVGLGNLPGVGGTSAQTIEGMRVVSTVVLAPNRSVHVLKLPGGKAVLVGATPNQVNLIAELSSDV